MCAWVSQLHLSQARVCPNRCCSMSVCVSGEMEESWQSGHCRCLWLHAGSGRKFLQDEDRGSTARDCCANLAGLLRWKQANRVHTVKHTHTYTHTHTQTQTLSHTRDIRPGSSPNLWWWMYTVTTVYLLTEVIICSHDSPQTLNPLLCITDTAGRGHRGWWCMGEISC